MSVHNTIITSDPARDFSSHRVRRSMGFKTNVKELQALKKAAPKENREMIQTLIDLYTAKKIPNYRTAENAVTRLALKTKSKAIQAKALKDFEGIVKKYKDALPTTGRLSRELAEKRLRTGGKVLSITLILLRRASAGDAEATVNVQGPSTGQEDTG